MDIDPKEFLKHLHSDKQYRGEIENYWRSMQKLPDYDYSKFYSTYDDYREIITQGDVIANVDYIKLPSAKLIKSKCMIISSTCDIHLENERKFPSRILYAPVVLLSTLEARLRSVKKEDGERRYDDNSIKIFFDQIKNQEIGQIFFLPKGANIEDDAIIFFDTICSNSNINISRDHLADTRQASLSAYATHIFLSRLSLFFTRTTDDTVQLRFNPSKSSLISG